MFYYIFLYILFYALLMSCFVKKRMYVVVSQNLNLQPSYPLLVTLSPELPVDWIKWAIRLKALQKQIISRFNQDTLYKLQTKQVQANNKTFWG